VFGNNVSVFAENVFAVFAAGKKRETNALLEVLEKTRLKSLSVI
jgi:hypothetical protein